MAGTVTTLRHDDGGGDDRVPPGELYRIAVEEYRFQAQFNWSRTQYLLALNVAVLTAATLVTSSFGQAGALVFLVGLVAAVLAAAVVSTQHGYYRAARDRMRTVAEHLQVPPDQRADTTATLGGRRRLASVNQLVHLLLGVLAVADAVGLVLAAYAD